MRGFFFAGSGDGLGDADAVGFCLSSEFFHYVVPSGVVRYVVGKKDVEVFAVGVEEVFDMVVVWCRGEEVSGVRDLDPEVFGDGVV